MPAIAVLLAVLAAAPSGPFDAFARQVERDIAAQREQPFTVDFDALGKYATRGVDTSQKNKDDFVLGLQRGNKNQLPRQLVSRVAEGGSVKLLRVSPQGEGARALYRVLAKDGGLDYAELFLERRPAGVAVVDVYTYVSGQTLGDTARQIFISAAVELDMGLLDRLQGKERLWVENMGSLKAMSEALQGKQWSTVLQTFDALPPALRKERLPLTLRLRAAQGAGDQPLYLRAIADYQAAVPGDPSLDLVLVDAYVARKEWAQAVAAVDRLDQRVRDPYLEVLRGGIRNLAGDREGARRHWQAALQADRTMEAPYWNLLTLALEEKDFARAAELMLAIETNTPRRFGDLTKVPAYAGFVGSKEYRAWLRRRPATSAPPAAGRAE